MSTIKHFKMNQFELMASEEFEYDNIVQTLTVMRDNDKALAIYGKFHKGDRIQINQPLSHQQSKIQSLKEENAKLESLLKEFTAIVKKNRFDYGTSFDLVSFLNKPEIKKVLEKV